jgi:flagellar hook assembly protein FlgD
MGQNYLEPRAIETNAKGEFYMPLLVYHVTYITTDVKTETIDDKIPDDFELYQNYPNPFNLRTTIKYDLDKPASDVELIIYNQLGEQILKKEMPTNAGSYNIHWDGESESGATLPSGVYFYNLKVDDKRETKSMVLLK